MFWHDRPGRPPFWALTRHTDVVAASQDPATFSAAANGALLDEQPANVRADGNRTLNNLDGPEHARLRTAIERAFVPAAAAVQARLASLCTLTLDRVCERGSCDFVADIATEFSLAVLCELLGIPDEEDRDRLGRLTRILDDPFEQDDPEAASRATLELFGYADELARWRRQVPGDDLVSLLVQAGPDGERLSAGEFELLFLLLGTVGHLTSQHLMAGAMLALLENSGQWQALVEAPVVTHVAVEELARWVSPVMQLQRTATRDTELGGQRIAAGDRVALYYVAANRDESVFADPDRLDLARWPNRQVGFGGGGPHSCLGSGLARSQARTLFQELTRRMSDVELADPVDHLGSTFVNGIRAMPVRFTPSGPVRLRPRG